MRDDILTLVSFLVSLLSSKKFLSSQFIDNYTAILSLMRSSDIESVHSLLDQNCDLTEKINLIDYEISSIKKQISGKSGIPSENINKYLSEDNSPECREYSSLITEIIGNFSKVSMLADTATDLLENEMLNAKLSIDDCGVLLKFRDMFYKQPN